MLRLKEPLLEMILQRPTSSNSTSVNACAILCLDHRFIHAAILILIFFNRNFGLLLAGWFCFIQTDDGKVVAVQHSPRESQNTVDFKRAIAAAFQANFKGTSEETESDPQSIHVSHYT